MKARFMREYRKSTCVRVIFMFIQKSYSDETFSKFSKLNKALQSLTKRVVSYGARKSELWDINSQLREEKSELQEKKSQLWVCFSELRVYISQLGEKKSEFWNKSRNYLVLFFIQWRKRASIIYSSLQFVDLEQSLCINTCHPCRSCRQLMCTPAYKSYRIRLLKVLCEG